jgi:hypothetical protein
MKNAILFVLFILSFTASTSQTKSEKKVGSWYFIYGTHKISDKWSITTGLEERNYETFQNYNLTLYTAAVKYKLSKKLTTRLGYMYLDIDRTFDPDVDSNTIENRYYKQLSYKFKLFTLPFFQRLRIEHRILNSMGKKTSITRARYRFKIKISLNKTFYLTASNESFLNFKGAFYAENRFCAALGLKATKNLSIETGYLGHYINNLHLDRLQLGIFFNTDLRKKIK